MRIVDDTSLASVYESLNEASLQQILIDMSKVSIECLLVDARCCA